MDMGLYYFKVLAYVFGLDYGLSADFLITIIID